MPDKGVDLGAELYELWRAGRDNLPTVAQEYSSANASVAATGATLASAFTRPAQFGGSYGSAYSPWRSLRDEFQTILADTATNLKLTGEALCLAASEFAATDQEAAAELERLKRMNGEGPKIDVADPTYPSPTTYVPEGYGPR